MQFKLLLLLCAVVIVVDNANSEEEHVYLWKITHKTKTEKPSYLLGTMFAPWDELYHKFPKSIENAIAQTDVIVTPIKKDPNLFKQDPNLSNLFKKYPNLFKKDPNLFKKDPNLFSSREFAILPENYITQLREEYPAEADALLNLLNLPFVSLYSVLDAIFTVKCYPEIMTSLQDKIHNIGDGKDNKYFTTMNDYFATMKTSDEKAWSLIEYILDLAENDQFKDVLKKRIEWFKNGKVTGENLIKFDHGQAYDKEEWKQMRSFFYSNDLTTSEFIHTINQKWVQKMHDWMVTKDPGGGQKSFLFIVDIHNLIQEKQSLIELLIKKGYKVKKWTSNLEEEEMN